MFASTSFALSLLGALLAVPQALARQIPVVEGIIGGVPTNPRFHAETFVVPAATTPGKLRVVENSGVCETTPGVYQASGYGDLTSAESMWYVQPDLSHCTPCLTTQPLRFWFFEARNNPATAPLAIWLNGGVRLPFIRQNCG